MPGMTKTEADWQAESDFDTLSRANEIMGDKKRLKKAIEYGKQKKEDVDKALSAGLRSIKNK